MEQSSAYDLIYVFNKEFSREAEGNNNNIWAVIKKKIYRAVYLRIYFCDIDIISWHFSYGEVLAKTQP